MIVIIEWVDACISDARRPMKADDEELRLVTGISVGHIVKETDDFISIAVDHFDTGEWPYRQCSSIPKACIKRMTRLDYQDGGCRIVKLP